MGIEPPGEAAPPPPPPRWAPWDGDPPEVDPLEALRSEEEFYDIRSSESDLDLNVCDTPDLPLPNQSVANLR